MTRIILFAALLLPHLVHAQQPLIDNGQITKSRGLDPNVPVLMAAPPSIGSLPWQQASDSKIATLPPSSIDYKTSFEQANAVAKRWKDYADKLKGDNDQLQAKIERMALAANDQVRAAAQKNATTYAPPISIQTSTSQNSTSGVNTQIRVDAERKWPNNYTMQEYEIKRQSEAYRNLHAGQ